MSRTLCFAVALLAVGVAQAARPNVLLIVADDLGWNDVGYHNDQMRTPRLDRLVRSGVELDCHYVQPQCTPTRVALMTGRYPSRFRMSCCRASNDECYPIGTPTLARLMQRAGYATGMSGKWHMGSKPEQGPNHHGFDYSHGSLAGAVGMYDHRYQLRSPFANTWHRNHERIEEVGHATDLTTGEVVGWIESHAQSDSPWFFYVPLHAVHTPLVEGDLKWHRLNAHHATADRRLYGAAVSHMDDAVGKMIDALDRTGQRERTLVVFTSDNGAQVDHAGATYPPPDPKLSEFSSNKPLRGRKTQAYEGGYRVPALVNWPAKLKPGKVTEPMHAADWTPTLAALLGVDVAEGVALDGRNVWPLISGEQTDAEDRTIYIVWGQDRQWEALRHGDWKIVRRRGQPWELYQLLDDPYEQHDRAAEEPGILASMAERYATQRELDADSR